ncbi:MAG: hypothetical protein AAF203_08900 [Pseudomonadota bacterium]
MGEVGFEFQGRVPVSKSLMNRALIAQSYFPDLKIHGEAKSDDVNHLRKALEHFPSARDYDCGDGGTTLRFLTARLSRANGTFQLKGSRRLFERPHHPLWEVLQTLGVSVHQDSDSSLTVSGGDWQGVDSLSMSLDQGSQFLSAILLNAWGLDFDLKIDLATESRHSLGYLMMTIDFLRDLGMDVLWDGEKLEVPKGQKLKKESVDVEPDMSSLFSLCACAAVNGRVQIQGIPDHSLQPDFVFFDLFEKMGIVLSKSAGCLTIEKSAQWKPVDIDLSNSPDLFPVLSVLLARAHGRSSLRGLELLKYKESNRLQKTKELLQKVGVVCEDENHVFVIHGKANWQSGISFDFDSDHDHRMAMAAGVAQLNGASLRLLNTSVVSKSFPDFWEIIGL